MGGHLHNFFASYVCEDELDKKEKKRWWEEDDDEDDWKKKRWWDDNWNMQRKVV